MSKGCKIRVRGLVQGVGFRPTVWRLAHQNQITGNVLNDGEGVLIETWGSDRQLEKFIADLKAECPPLARIDSVEQSLLEGKPAKQFEIVQSRQSETLTGIVADAATCSACIDDSQDPKNRRYRYAFTNCTHCGPRLTIIDGIPYDRAKTSMASFKLCDHCQREYEDPADRRFHAQPNACPVCGPKVWMQPDPEISEAADTIDAAAKLLQQGKILAIKGLGGFHLACDATNHNVVSLLRNRKHRYKKPFALMARDLDIIRNYCNINPEETSLLQSVEAPIVLLERNSSTEISDEVAPELKNLGFMLPYTPLHHLLLQDLSFPIVMTSGNVSDIPQCTDNDQAQHQLSDIADFFLLNDRDIRNRVDDSVARVVADKVRVLRRARGYAPATITLPPGFNKKIEVLAFGAELKNTFCMVKNGQAILSQHMGDLENAETLFDYKKNLHLYQLMFDHKPSLLVVDKHPEYLSTKVGYEMAQTNAVALKEVQHHHAHVTACLAENNWPLDGGKVLGVVLDGLGLGNDGTIWGCEFLHADYYEADRLGSLSTISLLGGTQAMLEPWRNTFSHLVSIMNWEELESNYQHLELVSFLKQKPVHNLLQMLDKGINSPLASSAGRLFDAIAGALGICRDKQFYEGQAAIELEALVTRALITEYENNPYSFTIDINTENKIPRLNPEKMWLELLDDLSRDIPSTVIAVKFHLGLAKGIAAMISTICDHSEHADINTIALSGGVFQNRILFEQVSQILQNEHYQVLTHSTIPANDGGIPLGQAVIALAQQG